jgi:hypothetical protein
VRPATAAAAPRPRTAPRVVAVIRVVPAPRPAPAGPTRWPELNRAIARIPSYRPGLARWVVYADDGHWGTVYWESSTILIGPRVPVRYLYDVAVHEWSHVLQLRPYGGDQRRAMAAMNAYFGGSGETGAERAADCMARLQGASWTHYTACNDARWRAGAARLIHDQPL